MSVAIAVLTTLLTGPLPLLPADAGKNGGFQVVVNAANPLNSLAREGVSRLFLKKSTEWPNKQAASPVDQRTDSPCRRAFSKEVLSMEPSEVVGYWNQMIFSGRSSPPPTKPSDADVLTFVRADVNAIGYVGPDAVVGEGIKVLKVLD